jgi:general secretion pathway protein E
VRIGSAGLTRVGDGKVLDVETLTEWLAKRSKLPYVRSTRSRSTSAASPT